MGQGARPGIAGLLEFARDPDPEMRVEALESLGWVGRWEPGQVVPVLLQCLADQEARVRAEAAEALGKMARQGAKVEDAVPALRQAAQDPDQRVRNEAEEALENIARAEKRRR